MKISKKQILQLSVVSLFVALISINALFEGATERMVFVSSAMVASLKFALHGLNEFLNLFIYAASIFCILGLVLVYVPMLFLSFRNGRQS